jgi:hypothetical protein
MTRHEGYGYKHMQGLIVHLYTECPEGKMLAIAKRDSLPAGDPITTRGLDVCGWCRARELELNGQWGVPRTQPTWVVSASI